MQQCPGQLAYSSHSASFVQPLIQPFRCLFMHAFIQALMRVRLVVHMSSLRVNLVFCIKIHLFGWRQLLFHVFKQKTPHM